MARTVLNVIDLRARTIETLDEIERSSVDYYASIRSLYRQSRADAIRNGAPSTDLPDFDSGGGVSSEETDAVETCSDVDGDISDHKSRC